MGLDESMRSCIFFGHEAARMAFFNDLVRAIAAVEGMEEMSVRGIGLSVRDAGYIAKGGRGLSAAKMTAKDAANLLIGVNASIVARDAGEIIQRYRDAAVTDRLGLIKNGDGTVFEATKLHQRFGSFIETMIEAHMQVDDMSASIKDLIDIDFSAAYKQANDSKITEKLRTEISFFKPEPGVDVYFVGDVIGQKYGQLWFMGKGYYSDKDRKDTTTITDKTLRAVAKTLLT